MFLQESDVFMDAMLAANTLKEPRKRKRRGSMSKDLGPSDVKKDSSSPSNSPKGEDTSPSSIKPTFKFYQDTLDISGEEDKFDNKMDESLEFAEPNQNCDELADDLKSAGSEDDKIAFKGDGEGGPLKGLLTHPKGKKQKKSVTWKEDLEAIKYFELDETERVNVTKNFADMKNMEREQERENVQIARQKGVVRDAMKECIRWTALIPIDIAAPVVAPGKNSQEKDIQYAREKTVAAAIYFNEKMIPESPASPDMEIHAQTDPTVIPLEDITGTTDTINDFTTTPWPESKGLPPAPVPEPAPAVPQPPAQLGPPTFQPGPGPGPMPTFPPQGPFPPMGPFLPGPPPPGIPIAPAGDCWRTGDGKVVAMSPEMFAPPGMLPPGMPPMGPGPMMLPPGVTPDMPFPMPMGPGPNPTPEEMAQFAGGFPPMGPSPPQMFGPPGAMGPNNNMGGNWQNPGGGGGGWFSPPDNDQPPVPHNQGRFQGNTWRGGGSNRGGGGRNPDGWGGGGSGGNSRNMPICNNFLKRGFCRNNNCRFRHPNSR